MNPFEQLFAKAELQGLIEQNKVSDKLDNYRKKQSLAALRHNDLNMFSYEYCVWLQDIKNLAFTDQFEYLQFCNEETTFDLFVEFIHYRKAETKKNIAQNVQKTAANARYNERQLIAMEILGLTTGENNFNPVQPVFHYIDEVLIKHNLTPKQAAILLEAHTGGLSPTTNKSLTKKVIKHLKKLDKYGNQTPPQQGKAKAKQETIERKPVLKPEAVKSVFDILKDFFSTVQQNELKQLLETGSNNSQHLIFLDNGNRLADAFKQLIKADVITQCEQKELESWIAINFKYTYRKAVKEYSTRYLNDIISTNKDKCQNPLLNVKTDKTTGEIKITKA
jgi:hypothetical protein